MSSTINFTNSFYSDREISSSNLSPGINPRIENEIEALQSIYLDNVERVTSKYEGHYEIKIKLIPEMFSKNNSKDKEPICWLEIHVKYHKNYPAVVPDFEISNKYNLNEGELNQIMEGIDDIAFDLSDNNMEMMLEICQFIQKFLDEKNRAYNPNTLKFNESELKQELRRKSDSEEIFKIKENYNDIKKFLKEDDNITYNTNSLNINFEDSDVVGINRIENIKNSISRFSNDFEMIEKIGQGGGGSVYKVKNKFDGMLYAIKRVI